MAPLLRASVAALVVAASMTACSVMFPTSSLRGAETDASDAAPQDAPVEAAPNVDAGTDASDGGRWCASQTGMSTFCDDFDDEGPFSRWTGDSLSAGGTVARSGTAFRSAPYALLAVTPASNGPSSALVYRSTTATMRKVHVAFDMQVDARDAQTGYAEVNYIRLARGGSAISAAFYMRLNKSASTLTQWTAEAYLADGGTPQHNVTVAGNPRFDQWTRVDLDVDLDATPHRMAIRIDGSAAGTDTLEDALYAVGPMQVELGLGYTGSPSGGWRIRYDNATIDWN